MTAAWQTPLPGRGSGPLDAHSLAARGELRPESRRCGARITKAGSGAPRHGSQTSSAQQTLSGGHEQPGAQTEEILP